MHNQRSSGVLLHLTSLPGSFGIGTLGKSAFEFIDFLKAAGQTHWQILPYGPVSSIFDNSPYMSLSAFAGNPLLIDRGINGSECVLAATCKWACKWLPEIVQVVCKWRFQ